MPTFTLTGFQVSRNTSGDATAINPVTLEIVAPAGQTSFTYTVDDPATATELPEVTIEAGDAYGALSGSGIPGGTAPLPDDPSTTFFFGDIQRSNGDSHTMLVVESQDADGSSTDFIFQVGGDPLIYPTTVGEFETLNNSITGLSNTTGALGPDTAIPFLSLDNTTTDPAPDNVIEGTENSNTLIGTPEDDYIVTGDNDGGSFGFDYVAASDGNDTIDMSAIETGWVEIDYSVLDGAGNSITVNIDGAANTGSVDKGTLGTDTLRGVEDPLFSGWTTGGLGVNGTAGNDSYTINLDNQQWMSVKPGDGTDSFSVNGPGTLRLDFRDATEGVEVNLATDQITNDGFGNTETIGGTSDLWEVQGSSFNDTFFGSGADESYRAFGGNNVIDGGAGFDRVRYDRFTFGTVDVDASAGTATGLLNDGSLFTDTISGIEWLRGSNGSDRLVGEAGVDNRFDGDGSFTPLGGADVFVHKGGNDRITDFQPGRDTLVVDVPGLDQAAVDAAVAGASEQADGTLLTLGTGEVFFGGLTTADLTNAEIQSDDGLNPVPGSDDNDTLTGTAGDDLIVTGNNAGGATGYDSVVGSAGDDTIDMTGIKTGYVVLDYAAGGGNATPISVTIDGYQDRGVIDKGGTGTDTLRGVVKPLDAGGSTGGLGLRGTAGDDSFDLSLTTAFASTLQTGRQWISVRGGDGTDSYTLNGDGYFRLDFRDATQAIDVDLSQQTGQIADDGFGNIETIGGSKPVSEIHGTEFDDTFTGSNNDETYRDFGGNDTLDGGGGLDRLRYDRDVVTSVEIDGNAGTATGTLQRGGTFTDTFSNFEAFRGSNGDDRIELATDADFSRVEGLGGNDTLTGSTGDDTLDGGAGNDQIDLVGTGAGQSGFDLVRGSRGDDTIDFTGSQSDFVGIDYSGLGGPVTFDIDGTANTGSVDKGAAGTDTLVEVATPLDAGWTIGGLALRGTAAGDTFNLAPGTEQWMSATGGAGADTYNINGDGLVRLDFRDGGPIDVDLSLASGQIIDDGLGSTDTITGTSSVWEIRGSFGDDRFVGSDAGESWRDAFGNDTLDGGAGFDRLRYDSGDYFSGVDIDAAAGTVTDRGNPDFVDEISNFEWFRGSDSDDGIAGDAADNRLQGKAGNDTLIGRAGDDTLEGGSGEDSFVIGTGNNRIADFELGIDGFDVEIAGVTDEARDAALQQAQDGPGGAVVDFGGGNTLTFTNLTADEVASLSPAPPPPPATPVAWTVGDPHLLTLDGVGYDFHAIGEFVLLRGVSGGAYDGFEIQSRMGEVLDSDDNPVPGVSANVAVAARLGNGSEVMIDSTDATPLSLDGAAQTLADGGVLAAGDDRIYREGDTYTVVFAGDDGIVGAGDARLSVVVRDGRLDVGVQISEAMAGAVEGLLGDGDGNPDNDIARANGSVLERPLAFDDLYGQYRDDWRVDSDSESLFTYDAGESLAGFYDANAPADVPAIGDFAPAEIDAARDAVTTAGLEPGTVAFENAVLDFLLTDDEEFIDSSRQDTAPAADNTGAAGTLDQGETRVTINVGLEDAGGAPIEGAVVNFTAGGAPILGKTSVAPGDYEIRLGSNSEAGRVDAVRDYQEGDAQINVTDALDVLRMAVGLDPSFGPAQAENIIAGDIDQSGDVSVGDALDVLRFAVGLETENAPKWVFLDKDQDLSGLDKDSVAYQTGTDSGTITDGLSLEMTGVLLGDISAQPEV